MKVKDTKDRLIIEAEIQLIQTFPRASFGIEFIRMFGLTLKSPRQIWDILQGVSSLGI